MTWGLVAVAGATLVGGIASADSQRKAGNKASDAQQAAADAGIAQQNKQFEAIQKLLDPYVQGGYKGLSGQMDLLGTNGAASQQSAIDAIKNSPQFTSLQQQGEASILSNASATGGLRGGNTQAALGQFSPQLLSQLIEQQYGRLGGLTSIGQNAAAGVGNAGIQTGNQITGLLEQQGAAQAGAFLNQGKQTSAMWNAGANAVGSFFGGGGMSLFGGGGSSPMGGGGIGGGGGQMINPGNPYALTGTGRRF